MSTKGLRHIVVSSENYSRLKSLGDAGDSFNDVISRMLEKEESGVP